MKLYLSHEEVKKVNSCETSPFYSTSLSRGTIVEPLQIYLSLEQTIKFSFYFQETLSVYQAHLNPWTFV